MPTLDILGYLWAKRDEYQIETPAEVFALVSTLLANGLAGVTLKDQKVFGNVIGAYVTLERKTVDEWEEIVQPIYLNVKAKAITFDTFEE